MSRPEPRKKAVPARPDESDPGVPRSGSGAGSALLAMLKKRQMRATRDAEAESPPLTPAKKTANE